MESDQTAYFYNDADGAGLPVKLYKYRSLSGVFGKQTVEDIVLHSRLFWQSPIEFNDPFDCNPNLTMLGGNAAKRRFIKQASASFAGKMSRKQRQLQKKMLVKRPSTAITADIMDGWSRWITESSVTCFSGISDQPLMWAHYADSHRGVCWIFQEKLADRKEDWWLALRVKYGEERPEVDYSAFRERDNFENSILHKSLHWKYEQEYRMFEWRKSPGYRTFPKECLRGVIFGARIAADDEAFVRSVLAKRPELEIHRATIDDRLFKLNISREP